MNATYFVVKNLNGVPVIIGYDIEKLIDVYSTDEYMIQT
jgi:hypothetical protein